MYDCLISMNLIAGRKMHTEEEDSRLCSLLVTFQLKITNGQKNNIYAFIVGTRVTHGEVLEQGDASLYAHELTSKRLFTFLVCVCVEGGNLNLIC